MRRNLNYFGSRVVEPGDIAKHPLTTLLNYNTGTGLLLKEQSESQELAQRAFGMYSKTSNGSHTNFQIVSKTIIIALNQMQIFTNVYYLCFINMAHVFSFIFAKCMISVQPLLHRYDSSRRRTGIRHARILSHFHFEDGTREISGNFLHILREVPMLRNLYLDSQNNGIIFYKSVFGESYDDLNKARIFGFIDCIILYSKFFL